MLRTRGVDHDRARDLAQEAWARGWERISQLRQERSLQAWVNTIARNLMISGLRGGQRLVPLEPAHELVRVSQIDTSAIEANLLLQGCTPAERQLFEAYYLDGCSSREIAAKFRKSVQAVHTDLHRARRAVRTQGRAKVA
jgi:RNA polymerase sigma factor (sigma-70 family)